MMDLSTIWMTIANKIAESVNEKLTTHLAESVSKMHAPSGHKSKLSPIGQMLGRSSESETQQDVRGLFQKLLESQKDSRKTGRPLLQTFLDRSEPRDHGREQTTAKRQIERPRIMDTIASSLPNVVKKEIEQKEVDRPSQQKVTQPIVVKQQGATADPTKPAAFPIAFRKSPTKPRQQSEKQEPQRRTIWERMRSVVQPEPVESGGVRSKAIAGTSQPVKVGSSPPQSIFKAVTNWMGAARAEKDRQQFGQQWWKPGFGNGSAGGPKRTRFARAARLRTKAQARLNSALKAKNTIASKVGSAGYDPQRHRLATMAAKAAQERLGQATALDARATFATAGASGKVADALRGLGTGIVGMGVRMALPATLAAAVLRMPWMLRDAGVARIAALRSQGGEHRGQMAAAALSYDLMTDRLNARQTRETAASTQWLVDENNKLRQNLQPIASAATNILNNTIAGTTWLADKGIEAAQREADTKLAWVAELENAVKEFRLPNPGNVVKIADEMKVMREEERKRSEDTDKHMSMNEQIKGWVDVFRDQNGKLDDARVNAIPFKPLPKF